MNSICETTPQVTLGTGNENHILLPKQLQTTQDVPLERSVIKDDEEEEEEDEEFLLFPEILQSQKVTQTLCDYLDIRNSSVLINLFAKQFRYLIDDKLFVVFTKTWSCSNIKLKSNIKESLNLNLMDQTLVSEEVKPQNSFLDTITAINFFEKIEALTECSCKQLLDVYLKGYEVYYSFILLLDFSNKITNIADFFKDTKLTVQENTIILLNISRFLSSMVLYEYDINMKRMDKLNFVKEMWVNHSLNKLHNIKNLEETKPYIMSLLEMNENLLLMDYYKSLNDFQNEVLLNSNPEDLFSHNESAVYVVDEAAFTCFLEKMLLFFNKKTYQADVFFGSDYPMVIVNYLEEVIGDDLLTWCNATFIDPNYFQFFDYFYIQILERVIHKIDGECKNCYGKAVLLKNLYGFMKLYFDNFIQDFLNLQVTDANQNIREKLLKFEEDNTENLNKENELFLTQKINEIKKKKEEEEEDGNTKKNKTNFLRSFQHMLKLNINSGEKDVNEELEVEYNLKKLENNIGNIKNLIDLPLCLDVIQIANKKITKIMSFLQVYSSLRIEITTEEFSLHEKHCESVYAILLKDLDTLHLAKAFETSLKLLNEYKVDPEKEIDSSIKPLINFAELINVSDIILQLLQIFYKNEIENISKKITTTITKKKSFDFLNQLVLLKKNFELKVDDFVANGLNAGITKLMVQIEYIYVLNQSPKDYCPDESKPGKDPSICCSKVINILRVHCNMISQALTNKATLEIYNQEISERLFQLILKNLKKNIVNVDGGHNLITDLKHYLLFIDKDLKMKKLRVLFQSLINVGLLYTIDFKEEAKGGGQQDADDEKLREKKKFNRNKAVGKEIAKKICDSSLYHGVFTQDDVYDLITRRIDWYNIKPFVDKGVYGLDCCIM